MTYKIIGKYIKDLNFVIPNPKAFFLLSKNISNYQIKIDIKSNQVNEKVIEIQTTLKLNPVKDDFDNINTKIVYSAIIELAEKVKDKKEIEKIILVKVPGDIYSELRKIFIFIFESSGFKDIKISQEVDFEKLYNLNKVQ
tara:strand:+ start:432 stop:851 length:420 start_codon:yes stop_codon:yes gene_type:complete